MSFIKKNLLLCLVALFCLAAFFTGLYMTLNESRSVTDARRSLDNAEAQLSSLLNADPAPTKENVAAAEKNLAELQAKVADLREELQSGAELVTSEDGVSVIAGVQQYISNFQERARANRNEEGEAAPVATPDNFAFGFEQYIDEASVPENSALVALLDKQRQILSYLLTQLMAADPHSIEEVKREIVEGAGAGNDKNFSIAPSLSARVPGAIDTMAFGLTFTGYTDSLRDFLNRLADFELPIVVRSIQVTRPSGSETVVAPPQDDPANNIFNFFDEEDEDAGEEALPPEGAADAEVQKPVIAENISQFTVILEFIEVVLPEAQTKEVI